MACDMTVFDHLMASQVEFLADAAKNEDGSRARWTRREPLLRRLDAVPRRSVCRQGHAPSRSLVAADKDMRRSKILSRLPGHRLVDQRDQAFQQGGRPWWAARNVQ